jgi:putative ABC transport system permease protein
MSRPRSINSPVSSTLLLVGAIGIANVTVIGVLERRGEIGLCSALGAGRRHIRYQFLTESVLLSAVGGIAGVAIGSRAMP